MNELPEADVPVGLKLFWLGEPFLNPSFSDMLSKCADLLREKKNYYIDIHTNAFFMDDELSDILIMNSDIIPRITLSLDAYSKDVYRNIRRGGDLDKVITNIENFLKKRERAGKTNPGLIFQFIVMKENFHEAGDFVSFWKKRLNSIKKGGNMILKSITKISGYNIREEDRRQA